MKVTLEINLEGNLVLPVTHEVQTLGDVARLGQKLASMPAGARKLMPVVATLPVTSLDVKISASGKDATARRKRRGVSAKRARQEHAAAAAASA